MHQAIASALVDTPALRVSQHKEARWRLSFFRMTSLGRVLDLNGLVRCLHRRWSRRLLLFCTCPPLCAGSLWQMAACVWRAVRFYFRPMFSNSRRAASMSSLWDRQCKLALQGCRPSRRTSRSAVTVLAATRGYLRLPSPNRHFPPRSRMYDLHVAEGCVQCKKHHEGKCMILAYHQSRMGVSGSGSLSHVHLWPTATFVRTCACFMTHLGQASH